MNTLRYSKRIFLYLLAVLTVLAFFVPQGADAQTGGYSVSASPAEITAGEKVTLTWSYPSTVSSKDWVGLFKTDASNRNHERWTYLTNGNGSSISYPVYEPGTYEARIFLNNGYTTVVAESNTITVVADDTDDDSGSDDSGDDSSDDDDSNDDDSGSDDDDSGGTGTYSLSVGATSITPGAFQTVTWNTSGSDNRYRDWVGLYEVGSSNRDYEAYRFVSRDASSGDMKFRVTQPGEYEFRYLKNNGYTDVATSPSFTVADDSDSNDDDSGDDSSDDDDDSGSDDDDSDSDTVTLGVPSSVTAGESFSVSYTGSTGQRDWIGIYSPSDGDKQYEEWEYARNESGSVNFTIDEPGTYEARFFLNNGYTKVAESQTFVVEAEDTDDDDDSNDDNDGTDDDSGANGYTLFLTETSIAPGETITVSWEAPSGSYRYRDWIGVYRVGTDDEDYIYWGYINRFNTDGELTFQINSPGTYEFRYFKNNGYNKVAVSEQFVVNDGQSGGGVCPLTTNQLQAVVNFPRGNGKIIAFGDSLTAGVGAPNGWDYVSQLSRQTGIPIYNAGISGDTTEEALARLESDVLVHNPSVVIVWLGGNDIIGRFYERAEDGIEGINFLELLALRLANKIPEPSGLTQAETFENLETIVEEIQDAGAITVLVGFGDGFYEEGLEEGYAGVAARTNSIYVPDILDDILGRPSLMADLVHPDEDGYEIVATRIQPYLQCTL